jgi:pimeloyl-ACP methyl ester carboxylesterase
MDDVRAFMDAAGSERAAVMGESEGGPLAMLFAAAHPERTAALILQGAEVRQRTDEDWSWGECTEDEFESGMASLAEWWGKGFGIDVIAPSVAGQEWARAWLARVQVHANTPNEAEAFMRMAFDIDVRHVAAAINVPTLIVHATGDEVCHVENARFLARTIPGARYVELPGADHVPWFEPDHVLAEIREFLTGQREAPRARSRARDRAVHRPRRLDRTRCGAGRPSLARPARAAPRGRTPRARALRRPRAGHLR